MFYLLSSDDVSIDQIYSYSLLIANNGCSKLKNRRSFLGDEEDDALERYDSDIDDNSNDERCDVSDDEEQQNLPDWFVKNRYTDA
jgi:hypothetical protein